MASNYIAAVILIRTLVCLLYTQSFMTHAFQSDIDCLRAVKASLHDPRNHLKSWDFNNGSLTSVCNFTGIECWNANDNRVLSIELSGLGLAGKFPSAVVNCTSMTGLNLSNNALNGAIPDNISHMIPFVTRLDLSYNQFCGQIPVGLVNCTFLNILKLNNNRLAGKIPREIGKLGRIKMFNVSNNQLSGQVPTFANCSACGGDSYANNTGLCGAPLPPCK